MGSCEQFLSENGVLWLDRVFLQVIKEKNKSTIVDGKQT